MVGLLIAVVLFGSSFGKIQGVLTDETTNQPLPFTSVTVVGTELGAETDGQGLFFILNVPSGRYTVRASCVGYQTKLVENVIVEVNQVARLKVTLSQQPIELTPAIVTAETPPIKKEMVAPTFVIKQQEIATLPYDYEMGVVMFQSSVVSFDTAIHVRGGRAHEVLYLIDNVSITDPQTGDLAINVSRGIYDEVIFMPGGFDVEYGRAMSGVINVLTARPSDRLRLRGSAKTERVMPFYFDFGYENYQAAIHLPVSKRVRGFLSFDVLHTGDWDPRLFILPHKERNDYSVYGKWVFSLPLKLKLTASGAKSMSKFDRYNSQWKFRLDHYRSDMRQGDLEALNLTYLPGPRYAVNLGLNRLSSETSYGVKTENPGLFERFTFKEPTTLRWPTAKGPNNPYGVHSHPYFYSEGDYPESELKASEVIKGYLSTDMQIHKYNEVKAGLEYSLLDLENHTGINIDTLRGLRDDYRFKPREFSCYIQDDVDYRGMYAKLGLRYDFYDVGIDTINPKMALSPRAGVSYMVTERFLLRTSFGRYVQPPLYDQCYSWVHLLPVQHYLAQPPLIGNPDLRPEQTTSLELGLQGEVRKNLSLAFSIFLKEVTDLLGTRRYVALPRSYVTYFNIESAHIKGIETVLDFQHKIFTGKISYTLSYAKGQSSYAEELYSLYYRNNPDTILPPPMEYNLDFDQRHRVFVQGTMSLPLQTKACIFAHFGNGFPYTPPGPEGKLEERNVLRLPFNRQIDLVCLRSFKLGRLSLDANLDLLNLLDIRYNIAPVQTTYPDESIVPSMFTVNYTLFNTFYSPSADADHDGVVTHDEYYQAFKELNRQSSDWPNWYTAPRRARIGVTVGF